MARYYKEEDINEILYKLSREPAYQHDGESFYNGICTVEGELMCLTPIEIEEVKQTRRLLHLGHRHYCSNCGGLAYMENYCSLCGAKVVEE